MNPSLLFIRTHDEIAAAIESNDSYQILRASALLRQLLIDKNRLIDTVNKDLRLKIQFEITDSWSSEYTKLIMEHGPAFYSVLDGLSPDTMLVKKPVIQVNRDKLLSHRVVYSVGRYFTVRDIIDHCANVLGGVHLGAPKSDSQVGLSSLSNIRVGEASVSIRQLVPVLRVVYKALIPVREALEKDL